MVYQFLFKFFNISCNHNVEQPAFLELFWYSWFQLWKGRILFVQFYLFLQWRQWYEQPESPLTWRNKDLWIRHEYMLYQSFYFHSIYLNRFNFNKRYYLESKRKSYLLMILIVSMDSKSLNNWLVVI